MLFVSLFLDSCDDLYESYVGIRQFYGNDVQLYLPQICRTYQIFGGTSSTIKYIYSQTKLRFCKDKDTGYLTRISFANPCKTFIIFQYYIANKIEHHVSETYKLLQNFHAIIATVRK